MRTCFRNIVAFGMIILIANCGKFEDIGSYNFEPNKPLDISNPLLWTVKAKCKIQTTDESDTLKGVMKKGTGTLNGQSVGAGVNLELKNGDSLLITASALASVEITNLGTNVVAAKCALTAETIEEINYMKSLLVEEETNFLQTLS